MMGDDGPGEDFGCKRCWPPSAGAAWKARGALTHVAELIDESHFHVMILACPRCTQRFVSVFTETVDWADGDDPHVQNTACPTAAGFPPGFRFPISGTSAGTVARSQARRRRCGRCVRPSRFSPGSGSVRSASG